MALLETHEMTINHPTEDGVTFVLRVPLLAGDLAAMDDAGTMARAKLLSVLRSLVGWSYDAPIKKTLERQLAAHYGSGRGAFPDDLGYLREIAWMHEHGLVSSYAEWAALPARVVQDARLWADADSKYQQKRAQREKEAADRAARGGVGRAKHR
jgi:hypothetical protein